MSETVESEGLGVQEHRLMCCVSDSGAVNWYDESGALIIDGEPSYSKVVFYVPKSIHAELSLVADLTGRSMQGLARHLIINYLRPGLLPPLRLEPIKELLQRRAEAILSGEKPKPRPGGNHPDLSIPTLMRMQREAQAKLAEADSDHPPD